MLTGFLGAGKTTALNALLANPPEEGARIAVVVNEFGELGIDAGLAQQLALSLLWTVYATALVIVGVRRDDSAFRWQGLSLMGLVGVAITARRLRGLLLK